MEDAQKVSLIAFLNARLDEDEAAAQAWLPFGNPDTAAREHIARHDPGRVLREVAAMRAIVQRYERESGSGLPGRRAALDILGGVLRDLAAIWSGHPDYDPRWTP